MTSAGESSGRRDHIWAAAAEATAADTEVPVNNMDLSVGSLDDPSVLTPVSHYAIETRIANWHSEDGLLGHRLDENEQIAKRWRVAYGDGVALGVTAARRG